MRLHHRTIFAVLLVLGLPLAAHAQGDSNGVRRIHFGTSRANADSVPTIPDSVLRAAVSRFNLGGGTKLWSGSATISPLDHYEALLVYGGTIRLEGTVDGDVLVINGDLLVAPSARIGGRLTVLGGRLIVQQGSQIAGKQTSYIEVAPIARTADYLLVIRPRSRSLAELAASSMSAQLGPVALQLDAGITTYNRTEGLVPRLSPRFQWQRSEHDRVRLDLTGLLRTASDPAGIRPSLGWSARLSSTRTGSSRPLTVALSARQLVAPMADRSFTPVEADLATLLFHEDYRDWYTQRGWGISAEWQLASHAALHGSFDDDREQTARSADPFSLLRNAETWRANPLADDGNFRRLAVGIDIDTRDNPAHTSSGWWLRATLRRVTSSELSPLSLPTSIRAPLPFGGYASNAAEFDLRRYLQLGPTASLHFRVLARGWLGGDPLLAQDRLSFGGGDILPGYAFRDGNCDSRRSPDPAKPALCDRQVALQAEYHRELGLKFATRLGRYSLGLDHPTLVIMANTGSAWLSGNSPGHVPTNRVQSIAEWRSDIGVGLDNRWLGIFLAKSVADNDPLRLFVRIRPRF